MRVLFLFFLLIPFWGLTQQNSFLVYYNSKTKQSITTLNNSLSKRVIGNRKKQNILFDYYDFSFFKMCFVFVIFMIFLSFMFFEMFIIFMAYKGL